MICESGEGLWCFVKYVIFYPLAILFAGFVDLILSSWPAVAVIGLIAICFWLLLKIKKARQKL